jgi:hypothetical protein
VESEGVVAEARSWVEGGRKAVLCKGVFLTWRDVSRGLGFGGCGEMWWMEMVDEGPDKRRRG